MLLLSSSERQLRVDIVRDEVLEVRLEESPGRLGLDAMQANSAINLDLLANPPATYHSVKNVKILYWHFFDSHAEPDTYSWICSK